MVRKVISVRMRAVRKKEKDVGLQRGVLIPGKNLRSQSALFSEKQAEERTDQNLSCRNDTWEPSVELNCRVMLISSHAYSSSRSFWKV